MSKKYFQAKKTTKNPFAIGRQYNKSQKHRFMVIALSVFIGCVLISSVITTIYRAVKSDQIEQREDKQLVVNAKGKPKRKEIKQIADEDFKDAKEYSFYTQLEVRSLDLEGSDRFGGVSIDSIHIPPPIILLESMGIKESNVVSPQNNVAIAPLILETSNPSEKIEAIIRGNSDKQNINTVVSNRTIHLQIGSFVSQDEAVNHRTRLEMYGFSPQIIRGQTKEDKTIYRVHLGPFSSKELPSIKDRLSALDINYFEIKQ